MTLTIDTDTILSLLDPVAFAGGYVVGAYGIGIKIMRKWLREDRKSGRAKAYDVVPDWAFALSMILISPFWVIPYMTKSVLFYGIPEER